MKKKGLLFICLFISIFSLIMPRGNIVYAEEKIYLGGMPAGFVLSTCGVEVVGVCDVITDNGAVCPSKVADIKIGDIILKINNDDINSMADIEKAINANDSVVLRIRRGKSELIKNVFPAKDMSGKYRLGVFIKDSVSGIGTVTFIKGDRFASLGHPIVDHTGKIIPTSGGSVYSCTISGCVKGARGKAGELKGVFLRKNPMFSIEKNLNTGVYGKVINKDIELKEIELGKATMGDAQIVSTINTDGAKYYNISIVKVDENCDTKNFVIKICDKELLEATGGIIQGMSGSPIIQNGKLVGAVTHVFLNDPTRGFGIDIAKMINN